jgi:LemA protein
MELLVILAVVIVVLAGGLYNMLVQRWNQVDLAAAGIDVYLKQRFDLIPNLVATVQGYMKHERDTLVQLTELRARAQAGNLSHADKVAMDAQMTPLLGGIRVAVENYPELKASQHFIHLQGSLNEVEEKIAAARRNFNVSATSYNNAVQQFPAHLLAGIMGFEARPLFAIPEAERQNPDAQKLLSGD